MRRRSIRLRMALRSTGYGEGWGSIERATHTPTDREVRKNMMSAAMQGAMALQKGLGSVHSLSHSLGALSPRLHHGTLNAIFLHAVVEFNQVTDSVRSKMKMARLAQAMGPARATQIPDTLRAIHGRLNLPSGLAEMGVTTDEFPAIAAGAMKDH